MRLPLTLALPVVLAVAVASPAAGRPLRVVVESGAPDRGEVALSFATLDLPQALTPAQRRLLPRRLRLAVGSGRGRVVAATATSLRGGRQIALVVASFRRTPRPRAHVFLRAQARLTDGSMVSSVPGPIWVGLPAGADGPGATHRMPGCGRLGRIWRTPPRPVLLTPAAGLLTPSGGPVRDGTPLVSGSDIAARILDQTVGVFCHPGFRSPWLRSLAGV